jgi:peptidoglycan/LPS O-acetylase OafA/YrhL
MNRATSLYIDLARFSAALVVFLGHISGQRLTGGFLWQIAPYMSHAVTIFFVLSGFVIAYATDKRENSAVSYAVSRAARIYSVVLPALAATVLLDTLGRYLQPALYSDAWGYVDHNQLASFALSALFLNEIWFIHVSPGSDLPYWSLGYEIWYYVIFGIFLFSPRKWFFLPVALIVIGPKIVSMLPLWLFGVSRIPSFFLMSGVGAIRLRRIVTSAHVGMEHRNGQVGAVARSVQGGPWVPKRTLRA